MYIYIQYIPSGTQVLRWPHTGCCSAADDHVVSCSATGRGGVGGGVGWGVLSFNVDHVVDAPLQMIMYHAESFEEHTMDDLFSHRWHVWNFPIEVAPWHVTGGIECRELEYQALDDFWLVNHLIDFDDCSMVITEIINAYSMMIYRNYLG